MDYLKVILTSLLSAVSLFFIAKVMGHKQMAQLDFFDYINGITIGSIAAELATELERPLKPLIAMLIYGAVSVLLAFVARKFPKMRKIVNGTPTVFMNDGKIYPKNMKKAKIELSEFMVMCRQAGYFDINDIQTAIFEYNGHLTILPSSAKRPLTPNDISLNPEQEYIATELIMDGRILHENLKRHGLNLQWLEKELKKQGFDRAEDIFLALCDSKNKLSVFKKA